jgi:hypothetical protein
MKTAIERAIGRIEEILHKAPTNHIHGRQLLEILSEEAAKATPTGTEPIGMATKLNPLKGGDWVSRKAVQRIVKKYVGFELFAELDKLPTCSPPPAKQKTEPIFELTPKGHEIYPNVKNLQKPELYWRVDWALDVKACLKHGILQEVKPERIELEFSDEGEISEWRGYIHRKDGEFFTEDQKQRMEDAINEG